MLIDHVILRVKAGDGGTGVVRWRREKGIPYGGPAGGDGGNGGDVYLRVVQDIQALDDYKNKKDWAGPNGEAGKKRSMFGADAEDMYLNIPVGSTVYNKTYNIKYECNKVGEDILILHGGKGGLGNENFKTSTNRAPEEFTKGTRGEDAEFEIELKLIADAGFVGLPSAGKSSLLNAVTNTNAKVGSYAFTTLEPNLGAFRKFILADIPGLIEGASEGKGLGHKFLKHIARTKILFHLVAASETDVTTSYKTIRNELKAFDKQNIDNDLVLDKNNLLSNKKEVIILSKVDEITDQKELTKKIADLAKVSKQKKEDIILISLFDDKSVKDFEKKLESILKGE
ncbi:MAG: Obg family GTPase CgtA [Candidatus Nomurabacteria bacterium]